jgi:hypothetical protein
MALVNKTLSAIRSVATFLCVVLNFASFHIYAATEVPNTFNSGTPALANEVNENFSALNDKIESISAPEKSYSVLSSETLDNGLVRTTLYAYEAMDYSTHEYYLDLNFTMFVAETREYAINALGKFRGEHRYSAIFGGPPNILDGSDFSPISCSDGAPLPRSQFAVAYTYTLRNTSGAFVFSNLGTENAGVYTGCDPGAEFYYLEGKGSGIYECVSRVVYHGAFNGGGGNGWSKAKTQGGFDGSASTVGVFNRSSNGSWGTYYLEIDAPVDCLDLDS